MLRTFTKDQIESLLAEYVREYPDAIERMHFVMRHPFRDTDDISSRSLSEIKIIAKRMKFFQDFIEKNPYDHSILVNNQSPFSRLRDDVYEYVADMLGPIGSYKIEK
ncbi:hypothetical protein ASG42_25825 [Rhizobium sp. Leaf391]|uniref:hypothetical protein n=1 Tax=Rhizobium sp. Leaf391 TaxID=1736360 RepID=UPI000712561A|nr:hypothetical protein [Rhizobium sp. Leaf391]KQT02900.1 hypothetical protein ASG42_25825 [Rhizobium sp. Leaf391]